MVTGLGEKDTRLVVARVFTVRVAVAVLPVPPSPEVTVPDVFVYTPEAVPITLTTMVHELFTATLPPERLMLVPPAAADAVPPQLVVRPFGVATTKPAGSVSLKASPVSDTVSAAGLVTVKVRVEI
jgi:hypothetical protein